MNLPQLSWSVEKNERGKFLMSSANYCGKAWYAADRVKDWGDVVSIMPLCVQAHERRLRFETCEHDFSVEHGGEMYCSKCHGRTGNACPQPQVQQP